ncbi:MAG TPA: hypothetical protein VFI47_22205 [Acidimicrobiales bacterium]|nr:hypothetical protein [Acidimicrobiales bacterium]
MRVHCCEGMRSHVEAVEEPALLAASDRPVVYDAVFDEYALARNLVAPGAEVISFCPFCGAELPTSKRDQWFDELRRRGLDPDDPALDGRFRSDAWWSDPRLPPTAGPAANGDR